MEDKKYYTPSIEEFHIGFEYEFFSTKKEWVKDDMKEYLYESILNGKIKSRVKHLDGEDIKSLGFSERREEIMNPCLFRLDMKKPIFSHHPELNSLYLAFTNTSARCILFLQKEKRTGINEERPETQLFNGYIRNKSELKRVLKQIGIKIEP